MDLIQKMKKIQKQKNSYNEEVCVKKFAHLSPISFALPHLIEWKNDKETIERSHVRMNVSFFMN